MPVHREQLREAIQGVYSEVVEDPKKGYLFHTGPEYAADRLGYSRAALAELPESVTGPFAGAAGQRKADKFETEGVNIRARKP